MKKKESKSSIRDQYTVVLEDIRSQVQGVAENVVGLHKKLDEFSVVQTTHTEMIGQLMVDVQEIKNDLKQKVGRDEFARLEKRVLMIERRGH